MSQFRHLRITHDYDRSHREKSLDVVSACLDAMLDMEISKLRTQVIPSSVACNAATLEYLKSFLGHSDSDRSSFSETSRVMADSSGLNGMPIFVDDTLNDSVVEARSRDGAVLIRFHLG